MKIKNIPTFCFISSRKKFWFNLNVYRNANWRKLHQAKEWFTSWFFTLETKNKQFKYPVEIKYLIWPKKNSDLMNIGSVIDKFMQDALVRRRILKDDSCEYVKRVTFEFQGHSKDGNVTMEIKKYRGHHV